MRIFCNRQSMNELHVHVSSCCNCFHMNLSCSNGHYLIYEIFGSGADSLRFRLIVFLSFFHHVLNYLRMLYIVWSLVRRRVTRRLTRLQTMRNVLKYRKIICNGSVRLRRGRGAVAFFNLLNSILYV